MLGETNFQISPRQLSVSIVQAMFLLIVKDLHHDNLVYVDLEKKLIKLFYVFINQKHHTDISDQKKLKV